MDNYNYNNELPFVFILVAAFSLLSGFFFGHEWALMETSTERNIANERTQKIQSRKDYARNN